MNAETTRIVLEDLVTVAARGLLEVAGEMFHEAGEDEEFTALPHPSLSQEERESIAPWIEQRWRQLDAALRQLEAFDAVLRETRERGA